MKHVPNVIFISLLFAQLTALEAADPIPPEGFRAIFNGKDLTHPGRGADVPTLPRLVGGPGAT